MKRKDGAASAPIVFPGSERDKERFSIARGEIFVVNLSTYIEGGLGGARKVGFNPFHEEFQIKCILLKVRNSKK
jgi:hypothetical protein